MNQIKIAVAALLFALILSLYGLASAFSPNETLAWYVALVAAGSAITLLVRTLYVLLSGAFVPPEMRDWKTKLALIIAPPIILGGSIYGAVALGIPSIYTQIFGKPVQYEVMAKAIVTHPPRALGPIYKLKAELPGGAGLDYLTVDEAHYLRYREGVMVILYGKQSPVGVFIWRWEFPEAANHSLQARRP